MIARGTHRALGGLAALAAAALGAAACRPAPADDRVPGSAAGGSASPSAPEAPSTAGLLERLALLATQRVPSADRLASAARAVEADPAALAGYVDDLLRDPGFAQDVAPSLFVVAGSLRTPQYLLKNARAGGEVIYYLNKPCTLDASEAVQPWWASSTTVHVCPDAHRPTYLAPPGTDWQCGSTQGSEAGNGCGCGPHLARCFRDIAQRESIRGSLRRENQRTIAWIVDHDLPIEQLFTSKATYREIGAELIYTNWRMLDGEVVSYPDPADWPRGGKWAPRPERAPGMHAGILTTPYTLLSGDATRALMRQLYELLWCKAPESSRVDAQRIWSLGVTDLRSGSGWQKLAAMPVCTRCHARLDHGAQFFSGFPGTLRSDHYMAALQSAGEEPMFGDDIDDPRGSAERTPQGFAHLVTAQDEFAGCMVERVARHVFGGRPSPDDADAMRGELARSHSLRAVVRVALLRAAQTWRRGATRVALPWPAQPFAADARGDVVLPAELRAELVKTCGDCHADGPRAFTGRTALDRPLLERMLRAVAFEDMPRDPVAMAPGRRRAVVHDLIAMLYADPAAREAAREAYEAPIHWRAPVSEAARLAAVHAHAGVPIDDWGKLDAAYRGAARGVPPRIADRSPLSPAMAVDLATAALADCERLGGEARGACLDRALRIDELVTPDAE